MKRTALLVTSFFALFLASVGAVGIGAAVDTPRTLMSPADWRLARQAIEVEARTAMAACRGTRGMDRDLCKAEARAAERVKKADLDARYHGTIAAAAEARQMRLKAQYDVARARCGGQVGDRRLECLRAARGERDKAPSGPKLAAT